MYCLFLFLAILSHPSIKYLRIHVFEFVWGSLVNTYQECMPIQQVTGRGRAGRSNKTITCLVGNNWTNTYSSRKGLVHKICMCPKRNWDIAYNLKAYVYVLGFAIVLMIPNLVCHFREYMNTNFHSRINSNNLKAFSLFSCFRSWLVSVCLIFKVMGIYSLVWHSRTKWHLIVCAWTIGTGGLCTNPCGPMCDKCP